MTDTLPISIPEGLEAGRAVPLAPRATAAGSAGAGRARVGVRRYAAAAVLVAALAVGVAVAWATGLRVFVVESPSMGEAAPVGTLLIGQAGSAVAVGDVITFQPPGAGAMPYSHRVVARTATGYRTRGDINGADDPWVVTPGMIISRVVGQVPGAGWLLRSAPVLLAALVAAQVAGLFLRSSATRWSARTMALALGVAFLSWTARPFSGYVLLQSTARPDGMHAEVISTALLPIRLTAVGGGHVELLAGQVGRLVLPRAHGGHVAMTSQLALDPVGWALVALVCLIPVLVVLVVGVPVEEGDHAPA